MGLNCGETALFAQTDGPLGVANHTLEGQGTALTGRVTWPPWLGISEKQMGLEKTGE